MAHLSLRLLGGFQATLDNSPLTGFDSDKTRALLAYLAVESERPQRREWLTTLLWPNVLDASARRSLSQALFNLRQILAESKAKDSDTGNAPFLLVGRDTIQFNRASAHSLDVATFQALQKGATVETLAEAAALYGGDFLQGFIVAGGDGFDEWAIVQRERLHHSALSTLEKLAGLHMQAHNDHAAIQAGERLLQLEPWREETHHLLMRLLARSGQRSRALAQYESCKQLLAKEFGVEPSAPMQRLYEEIRAGEIEEMVTLSETGVSTAGASKLAEVARPALPSYLTPFLGRERELAAVRDLLVNREARLITLTGYGGMGKTRLALQVANEQATLFRQGVLFAPLAAATSLVGLVAALAEAGGIAFSGALEPKRQLLNALADKQMLIILDNFESLLSEETRLDGRTTGEKEASIDFVLELLAAAPQLKVLITSREPLNLPGEWIVEVRGLGSAALTLFVQSAQRTQRAFALAEDDASVDEICQLVEQMPLAIELAAAWVQTLSCAEIVAEIRRDLGFLATTSRGIAERHRSIQAVFEQTWSMLSPQAQRVMSQLSLFHGGFQRTAATEITQVSLPLLATLVSKSLVRPTGEGRYQIHELMRQFAAERLTADPQLATESQARFSAYYAERLAEAGPRLRGPLQRQTLAELTSDWENLHTAWKYMIAYRQVAALRRSFTAIASLHEVRGLFADGIAICAQVAQLFADALLSESALQVGETLLEEVDIIAGRAQALAQGGWFHMRLGKLVEERAMLEQSRQLVVDQPGQRLLSLILNNLAVVSWHLGDHEEALQYGEEGVAFCRLRGDQRGVAVCLSNMANPYLSLNANQEAYRVSHEAAQTLREFGDMRGVSFALMKLGQAAFRLGQNGEAESWLEESISLSRSIGYAWQEGAALHLLGAGLLQAGEADRALPILQAGIDAFHSVRDESNAALVQATLADALTQLGSDGKADQRHDVA